MNRSASATVALVILALLSVASIVATTVNYAHGVRATRSVRLGLGRVEVTREDGSQVRVTLQVGNGSDIPITLEELEAFLYLNGHSMGTSYTPFSPRVLEGLTEDSLDFSIPISPYNRQFIQQASQEAGLAWSVRGRGKLLLPFRGQRIWFHFDEPWEGPP